MVLYCRDTDMNTTTTTTTTTVDLDRLTHRIVTRGKRHYFPIFARNFSSASWAAYCQKMTPT